MSENQIQVLVLNNEIIYIPKEFKDVYTMIQSEEFKEFQTKKRKEEDEKIEKKSIWDNLLTNGNGMIIGSKGTGRSMFDYVPAFVSDWEKKKRVEKINKLLKL